MRRTPAKIKTRPCVFGYIIRAVVQRHPFRIEREVEFLVPDYDIIEMLCVPSEMEAYSKDFGDAASGVDGKVDGK